MSGVTGLPGIALIGDPRSVVQLFTNQMPVA